MAESLVEGTGGHSVPENENSNTEPTPEKENSSLAPEPDGDGEDSSEDKSQTRGKYAGKYDTAEDLEKGYKESTKEVKKLQKQIKEAGEKAEIPEDFDLAEALKDVQGIPEGTEIDKDDSVFQHMMPAMREAGLTPEQAEHLGAEFVKMQLGDIPDPEVEIAQLGDNAKALLSDVGKAMADLPEDQKEIIESFTTRADEVKAMIAFAEKYNSGEKSIPDNADPKPTRTAVELEDEAFAYKKAHAKTIGANDEQQAHYNGLMKQAQAAKEFEKKNN